jgi:hypothetical protein
MVGQAVSGAAPQWNYTGVMATGTMGQSLTWQPLPNTPAGTPQSTNDIYIDPSGGTHILMRTIAGITQYFFIPSKGNPTAIFDIPGAYRARFIATNDMLFLTYSVKEHLIAHSYPLPSGTPLSKLDNNPIRIKTPPAYGTIFAIYPESRIYQTTPVKVASFAFTGSSKQNEVHEQVIR